ncbi:MAG: hypothetical protein K5633_01200 [Paludibacteraceae bacterium]|jgi:hypothetical protein|nr:hypothetical protein [Paludibacteraceae bacterium]
MQKVSKYILWAMMGISALLLILFFLIQGEDSIEVGGDAYWSPTFINPLLYWGYLLLCATVVITIVSVAIQYSINYKKNQKSAIKTLVYVGALILILGLTYAIGNGEKMELIGYEGDQNFGAWAKFTDMCLYTIYTLVAIAVCAILWSVVKKYIDK